MTTRGQINSNFYQIVDVDVDGNPTQVKPEYVPDVEHANTANFANVANVANVANSVDVANVVGIGNIATINLNGNSQQVLSGIGTWVEQTGGGGTPGGTNTQVQFNNNGAFGGSANLTFDNTTGILTANKVSGNGSLLTNLTGANVTGIVGNATHANVSDAANSVAVANVVGIGNIATVNLNGSTSNVLLGDGSWGTLPNTATANYANFAGQVVDNAQSNITSVGTLTSLNVSGNVTAGNTSVGAGTVGLTNPAFRPSFSSTNSGNVMFDTVSNARLYVGTYNSGAANTSTFYFANGSVNMSGLTVTGNITSGNITGGNLVSANYFSGNGSLLTSINGSNVTGQVANALVAGTVYTNAQPNITSLGNLTSMSLNNTVTPITANVGQMFWDTGEHTVSLGMENGVTQQIGLENYIYVKASSAITDGQVVMFTGASGDNVLAAPADVTSVGFMSEYVIGVATQSIATNGFGYITTFGKVHGLNTNSFNVGDILWLSTTTPGALTNVQPTDPAFQIQVAAVTKKSAGDGHIQVRVTPYWALNKLTDVTLTTPTTGQALIYNGSNIWINGNPQQSNVANVANSVAGSNVTGQVANALVAGTVYTNSQPNITSVGTLTGLTSNGVVNFTNASNVSLGTVGNVHISGGTSGYVLSTNGSGTLGWTDPGSFSTSAAGANTQIQFNSNGLFSASNAFTFTNISRTADLNIGTLGAVIPGNTSSWSNAILRLNATSSGSVDNQTVFTKPSSLLDGAPLNVFDAFGFTYEGNGTGDFTLANVQNANLGDVGTVKITGGFADWVLKTDGTGNLDWIPVPGSVNPVAGNIYNIQYNSGSNTFAAQDNFNFYPFDSGNNTPAIIELGITANTPGTGQPWSGGQLTLLADSGNGIIRKTKENGILIQDNSSAFDTVVTISANTISLGSNANINITGGSTGQVLTTDGAGNLSWTTSSGGGSTTDFTPSFLLGGM